MFPTGPQLLFLLYEDNNEHNYTHFKTCLSMKPFVLNKVKKKKKDQYFAKYAWL